MTCPAFIPDLCDFLLTILTVLGLPINIIAGLFGMNVGGIPMAQEPHRFWIVVAIITIFSGIALWYSFKKQRD